MYKLATRGSKLALRQSEIVQNLLKQKAGLESELVIIKTIGDKLCAVPLSKISGQGLFTREIEQALLEKRADLAVHSLKDLPIVQPSGLTCAAIVKREDPSEVIVTLPEHFDREKPLNLCKGLTIGTSAVRRKAQIKALRPDLTAKDLRGNITTRVEKVKSGQYDAVMIAYAGLLRANLDLSGLAICVQSTDDVVPAPAQGALAVEVRSNDKIIVDKVIKINDEETAQIAYAERKLLLLCGGGCHLPLGANISGNGALWKIAVFWSYHLPNGIERHIRFILSSKNIDDLVNSAFSKLKSTEIDNLLDFYGKGEHRPRKLLITRSAPKSLGLAQKLKTKNVELVPYPVLKFNELYDPNLWRKIKANLDTFDYLIFTSAIAVDYFGKRLRLSDISPEKFARANIAAVGEKTAAACEHLFANKQIIVSSVATGKALAEYLAVLKGTASINALFPCAKEAGKEIQVILAGAGWKVERINIYETLPEKAANLANLSVSDADYICFTSSLAVEYTYKYINIPDEVIIISIGPKTTEKVKSMGARVDWEIPNSDLDWLWQVL